MVKILVKKNIFHNKNAEILMKNATKFMKSLKKVIQWDIPLIFQFFEEIQFFWVVDKKKNSNLP